MKKLKNKMKFLLRSLIIKITQPLINFIMTSKIGRSLYFDSIPPNKMVIANTDDLDFVVNSSDKVIGKSTFVNQVPFESELLSLSIEYLHRNKKQVTTLLDIGANIGTVGLTAVKKKMVNQCIAFEPDPLNYNYLLKNILINDLNEFVTTYNVGLSNGLQDQMEFEVDRENFGDHRLRLKADNGLYEEINRRVILVNVMKLDDYLFEIPLDSSLIWMDTQGAEGLILKGANNLLKKTIPIVTEFWPYGLNRLNCFDDFLKALDLGNYQNFILLGEDDIVRDFNKTALLNLAEKLGWQGGATNILIF